jgi:hypothetical protein
MGEKRSTYRFLIGEPEENRSSERTRRSWKDLIKMDLREKE